MVWDEIQQALAAQSSFGITYRLLHRDGEERELWEQGSGIYDDDGNIVAIEGFITEVANALLRAAQAVKLLGAQVIITGIRPEVAQTLIGLGLDLSGIITVANLQGGIQYALARKK